MITLSFERLLADVALDMSGKASLPLLRFTVPRTRGCPPPSLRGHHLPLDTSASLPPLRPIMALISFPHPPMIYLSLPQITPNSNSDIPTRNNLVTAITINKPVYLTLP